MVEPTLTDAQRLIVEVCDELKAMLLEKNSAYGNSVLDPIGVFAPEATPDLLIRTRLDDKLSRLKRGQAAGEDVEWDLLGYLILLRIARRRKAATDVTPAT